ncbi:MAG: DEAD/DEAH box helicase family protein [Solobacterium sp.]|nr:DEAD/DEAH box helicase family protein [Solobacterium sp.]
MLTELRPYQEEARQAIENEWASGVQKTLLVLPTGTGKTVVFSKVVEDRVREGDRVLIMAHRGELLNQAADKLGKMTGLTCALEKAEETCLGKWNRVVIGSVQSLQRPQRLKKFPGDYFSTIVVDEAHHAITDGYRRILEHFPSANVLGVTATPDRGDMKNLGEVFQSLAYEYSIVQAIREGYLCKIMAQTIPLQLDMSGLKTQAGDYTLGSIDTALDPYLEQIAEEMEKFCKDRKTVVFLPLIKTSQKFRDILNRHGFHAAEVNGMSEDREEILRDFDNGKYNILCNSMLLTEGWDCPSVDCIVVLRPTKVRSLYCQMVGRGTRLSPGKSELLLLDFLWLSEKHELCRPADIICKSKEVAQKMTDNLAQAGCPEDIEKAEKQASEDVLKDREERLAAQLEAMKKRKKKLVDPLQFEMSIQAEDLANYEPTLGWQMGPASQKQLEALEKYGIFPDEVENAGKADLLLDKLAKRRMEGLTTPKQIRFLEGRGFQHVGVWTFIAANNMIARISANNWRIPAGIDPATYVPQEA